MMERLQQLEQSVPVSMFCRKLNCVGYAVRKEKATSDIVSQEQKTKTRARMNKQFKGFKGTKLRLVG